MHSLHPSTVVYMVYAAIVVVHVVVAYAPSQRPPFGPTSKPPFGLVV